MRFSIVVLLAACGGEPAPQTVSIAPIPVPSSSQQAAPVSTPAAKRADHVVVDKHARFDDCDWWILEARDAGQSVRSNSEFNDEEKKTDGRFIMVHYKLTNLGQKEEMMLDRAKIQDDKGREFGPVDMESFYVPGTSKTVGLDTLFPGKAQEYWTVIEVPADAKELRFKVHGFTLIGPQKLVALGL